MFGPKKIQPKKYPNFHKELYVTHEGYPHDNLMVPPGYSGQPKQPEEYRGHYGIFESPENVLKERADGPILTEKAGYNDPTKEKYVGHYVLKEIIAIRGEPKIRHVDEGEIFAELL